MLLPVFVATFAGLRVGAFRIMGGCRRAFESPRTIHKGKNTAIGHARLEEVGSPPEDSPPRRWQTVEIGARAGGLVDNPPVRFRPRKTLGFTGCSSPRTCTGRSGSRPLPPSSWPHNRT